MDLACSSAACGTVILARRQPLGKCLWCSYLKDQSSTMPFAGWQRLTTFGKFAAVKRRKCPKRENDEFKFPEFRDLGDHSSIDGRAVQSIPEPIWQPTGQ